MARGQSAWAQSNVDKHAHPVRELQLILKSFEIFFSMLFFCMIMRFVCLSTCRTGHLQPVYIDDALAQAAPPPSATTLPPGSGPAQLRPLSPPLPPPPPPPSPTSSSHGSGPTRLVGQPNAAGPAATALPVEMPSNLLSLTQKDRGKLAVAFNKANP